MRRGIFILLLLASAARAQGTGADAEGRAFVEVDSPRASYFVGEAFRVRVLIGFDRQYFDTAVVPLFGRRMDFQAKLTAPFIDGIEGTVALGDHGAAAHSAEMRARGLTFALNDEVVAARRIEDRVEGERTFTVLLIERAYLPKEAGEIPIAAPELRFKYATEFKGDFISGQQPIDPQDAVVTGSGLRIQIRELPSAGRPRGFSGAVGRFTVRAEADRSEVSVGESLKVALLIEGTGNLTEFDPPRLDRLQGFHVYGAIDDRAAEPRRITYDLAPVDATVTAVPPITLSFFDPAPPGEYRQTSSTSIPLSVLPSPAGVAPPRPPPPPVEKAATSPLPLIATAVGLILIGAIGVVMRRKAQAKRRIEPAELEARAAADLVGAMAGEPGADLAATFSAYLALRLSCAPAAVIGPDLAARLVRAGVPRDIAARTAALMEDAVGAHYGGDAGEGEGWATAADLVSELEASFRTDAG